MEQLNRRSIFALAAGLAAFATVRATPGEAMPVAPPPPAEPLAPEPAVATDADLEAAQPQKAWYYVRRRWRRRYYRRYYWRPRYYVRRRYWRRRYWW